MSRAKSMKRMNAASSSGTPVASQSGKVATTFVEPIEKSEDGRQPLFRFGLISDTQYVDAEDGHNFTKSKVRRCAGQLPLSRSRSNSV
eukprot:1188988-Prorocentrum_minimum.AAC.3